MSLDFDAKVMELAAETRQQLAKSEELIKQEREKLDLDECFHVGSYFVKEAREYIAKTLQTYRKQLAVEKSFYIAFHNNYIKRLDELCEKVNESRRKSFWEVAMPKLLENHEYRMRINEAKMEAVKAAIKLVKFADKNEQHFYLESEEFKTKNPQLESQRAKLVALLDEQLELQYQYATSQRERYV